MMKWFENMRAQNVRMNLWEVRTEKGMSIMEIAKQTGIGKSSLYEYENNRTSPPLEAVYRIAAVLGVEMEVLYTSEKNTPP